jgi:hypothetical protein
MGAMLVLGLLQCSTNYSIEELDDHKDAADYFFATMQVLMAGFVKTLIIILLFHDKKKLLIVFFSIMYLLFFGGTLKRLFGMQFFNT